jgi:hypothetical protein
MTVTINGTTGVAGVDGTASTPAIQGNDTNTGIFFPAADTIAFAEGGAEVARFDSNGNLGIGTTDTSGIRLGVNSGSASLNTNFTSTNASGVYVRFQNSGTSIGDIGAGGSVISGGTAGDFAMASRSGNLVLGTGSSERMRIDSSGNLLVGTTSATGGRQMIAFDNIGQTGTRYIHNNTTYNGLAIQFLRANNSTSMGGIYCDGSNTQYQTSSDYRLKENIQPMINGLDKVMQLKPCTYKWKDMDKAGEGFIAHELQSVVPDCVYGEKDAVDAEGNPQYQGIDTSFLVATLTAAIQEQQAIITDLKARIETLENK